MIHAMTEVGLPDPDLENALLALEASTGRNRSELLRDMILNELHFIPSLQGNPPPKKSPNVSTTRRSNLV